MENRDIRNNLNKIEGALETYSQGISDLRGEALNIVNDFLEKPPEYWDRNPNKAQYALTRLNTIEQSGRSLEADLGSHFPNCNE